MSLWSRPRIVGVEAPHGPIALAGGRTPLRVVAEGSGVLEIAGVRRRFRGGLDENFLVPVAPRVVVRVRGPFGVFGRLLDALGVPVGDVREIVLDPLAPAPAPVDVALQPPGAPVPRVALRGKVGPLAPRPAVLGRRAGKRGGVPDARPLSSAPAPAPAPASAPATATASALAPAPPSADSPVHDSAPTPTR